LAESRAAPQAIERASSLEMADRRAAPLTAQSSASVDATIPIAQCEALRQERLTIFA